MVTGPVFLLVFVLSYATVTDIRSRRIPNKLTFPILVGGLILQVVTKGQSGFLTGLAGAGVALAIMIGPYAMRWLGAGDVKLAMVVGALMGPDFLFASLLYAALAAGALALFEIIRQRQVVVTLSYLFSLWYLPAPPGLALKGKLPYAPAMAVGCLGALLPLVQDVLPAVITGT